MKKIVKAFLMLCFVVVAIGMNPITANATGEENPRVIIESYAISEDEVIPGQEFELTLTLRNTSQFYDVYNVVITMEDISKSVYPVYGGTNQAFVNRIYARKNTEIKIPLKAADDISVDVIPLQFNVSYNDNYFIEKQDNDIEISLPVRLVGDLNVVASTVPKSVSKGTKARISLTYENTGSESLYNVILKTLVNDTWTDTNLYSIGGGEKSTTEVYLDCQQAGDIVFSYYFVYEDEKGESYRTNIFSDNVQVVEANAELNQEGTVAVDKGVDGMTFVILAAIVIVAIVILIVIKKRRR
ncbi:MAG: hypothetical protein II992_02965 [Lachnospiraceae bacterium]|nr:hypothetical protein [Lachnospiraceae bacterium]MBQ3600148.1 hypothetical protein [Lachnospiraceae bacterium]MBQ6995522.1 hypothetical protein [Lachnospiraceae bacterium]